MVSHDTSQLQAAQAMTKECVKVNAMATVKETLGAILAARQRCALVVDENDLLEGIMTPTDLQREVLRAAEESIYSDVPSVVEVQPCMINGQFLREMLDAFPFLVDYKT